MSTRNTLPLPHPEPIRSPLPLTIRGFCLCLATLKPSLILAGRSRPRPGQPCSSVSSRESHCDRLPVITVCLTRRSGVCCVPLGAAKWVRVSTDHLRGQDTSCSVSRSRQRTKQAHRVLQVHLHKTSVSQEVRLITGNTWLGNGSQAGSRCASQRTQLSHPS